MSDVTAAATLSLAISTGDAANQLGALKTAYGELKSEFAKGLPSTGISKEATTEINNLKAAIAGYEAKNRDLNSQVQLLTDRFKDFSAAAKSSAATMSAGLSGVAVKARADLKEIGDTYSGAVNKILAERQRLASKGIDFGSSVKGLELVQKSTTENTKELAKYIKTLEVAKVALGQLDAPELLKQKHGDTILAEIAKLDAYKAQLASALNVRSRVNSYAPMYADDYAAEQKAAANLLALKAQTASQQNIENAAIAKEIELQQRLNALNEKGLAEARLKANLALRQQETEELRKQEVLLAARQRASVSYLSGTPRQQAAQVVRASVAIERGYDTAGYAAEALAAAQNVEKLAAAKAVLAPATRAATVEQHNWNKAAKDGHAFARGLSGSLGALWMTYGNLAPLMAGAALAGGFKAAVTSGSELAHQLTFVKALGNESAEAMQRLSDSTLELSKNGPYKATDIASGYRMLAQAGLSAADSLAAMPHALNLATVGEMNMEQAGLALVGVMNAFNLSVKDSEHIGDVFAKAAAVSQTSVDDMTQAMRTASVAGAMYGASMEDTATALTLLAQVNIKGTAAGTSYRNMLKELYTPTDKAASALKSLGVSAFDSTGKMRTFVDVIYDMREAVSKLSGKDRVNVLQDIFGERGSKEAIQMLSLTRAEWDKLHGSIKNSSGFMKSVADKLNGQLKIKWEMALNTMSATLIKAFKDVEPQLSVFVDRLKEAFGSDEMLQAVKNMVLIVSKSLTVIADHAGAIKLAAEAWLVYKAALIAVRVESALTAKYISASNTALAASRGGMAVQSIAGSGAAAGAAAATVAPAVVTNMARFKTLLTSIPGLLMAIPTPMTKIAGLAATGATAWMLWGDSAKDAKEKALSDDLGVGALFSDIGNLIQPLVQDMSALVSSAWDFVKAIAETIPLFDILRTTVESARLLVSGFADGVKIIGATLSDIGARIMGGFGKLLNGISIAASEVGLDVGDSLQAAASGILSASEAAKAYSSGVYEDFKNNKTAVQALTDEIAKNAATRERQKMFKEWQAQDEEYVKQAEALLSKLSGATEAEQQAAIAQFSEMYKKQTVAAVAAMKETADAQAEVQGQVWAQTLLDEQGREVTREQLAKRRDELEQTMYAERRKRSMSAQEYEITLLKEKHAIDLAAIAESKNAVEARAMLDKQLAEDIAAVHAKSAEVQISYGGKVVSESAKQNASILANEQQTAASVEAAWAKANAQKLADAAAASTWEPDRDRLAKGGKILTNTAGEYLGVSSWDENGRYIGAFATGGSFMVGGSGGTDSQRVSFMASPDERVTIETPAQVQAARMANKTSNVANVTVNVNVSGGNPDNVVSAIQRAIRTNPNLFNPLALRAG